MVDPREVARLKLELSRAARSASAPEIAAFAARLKDVSLASIRQKLASRAISRPWKRDLAEAEIERRTAAAPVVSGEAATDSADATIALSIPVWAWWVAALLIAGSVAVVVYAAVAIWTV